MNARRASGALEAEVLAVLWATDQPLTAQQIRQNLVGDSAHTTVNTILTRLYEKGVVDRRSMGTGYTYRPVLDRADLTARRMRVLLDDEGDAAGVLQRFVAGLDTRTLRALRQALGEEPGGRDR